MRCFVAADIDDRLKAEILPLQKELARIADVKLVEPENLHFTLKFLGEIDNRTLTEAKNMLGKAASQFMPFNTSVKGMGAFPNINYIRVVWIGCPELYNLQKTIDDSLVPLFKKEKEINPHLTLARIRSERNKEALADFINKNKNVEIGSFHVEEIMLKSSKLMPKGPVYEDVEVFRLGSQQTL